MIIHSNEVVKLHDEVRIAMGWEFNGNGEVWNPKAPDREDPGFLLLDAFQPVWDMNHMDILLQHLRLRGFGFNIDSYGDNLDLPFTCCLTYGASIVADRQAETIPIAVCYAAIEAMKAINAEI